MSVPEYAFLVKIAQISSYHGFRSSAVQRSPVMMIGLALCDISIPWTVKLAGVGSLCVSDRRRRVICWTTEEAEGRAAPVTLGWMLMIRWPGWCRCIRFVGTSCSKIGFGIGVFLVGFKGVGAADFWKRLSSG